MEISTKDKIRHWKTRHPKTSQNSTMEILDKSDHFSDGFCVYLFIVLTICERPKNPRQPERGPPYYEIAVAVLSFGFN